MADSEKTRKRVQINLVFSGRDADIYRKEQQRILDESPYDMNIKDAEIIRIILREYHSLKELEE